MLTYSENFLKSLSNSSNYAYYIVHIDIGSGVWISNKKGLQLGNQDFDGNYIEFIDRDLRVGTLREEIDLKENKFKTSQLSFTLSNRSTSYESFSDVVTRNKFTGAKVKVYVASNGSQTLLDCINIYTGYITDIEASSRDCEITLEDYSTYTFSNKSIPKRKNSQATQELIDGSENIPIPLVYGHVERAKMLMTRPHINDLKTYIYPDAVNQGIEILGFSNTFETLKVFRDKMYLDIPLIFQEVGDENDPLIINGLNYNMLYVGEPQYDIEKDHIVVEKKLSGNAFTEGMPLNIQAREQFQVDVERTPSGIQPTSSDSILQYGYAGENSIVFNGHQNGYNIGDGVSNWAFPIPQEGVSMGYYENIVIGHITRKIANGGEDSGWIWYLNHCLGVSRFFGAQYDTSSQGVCEMVRRPTASEVMEFLTLPDGYEPIDEARVKIDNFMQYDQSGANQEQSYPSWEYEQLPAPPEGENAIEYWSRGQIGYFEMSLLFATQGDGSSWRHPAMNNLGIGVLGSWQNVAERNMQFDMVYAYQFTNGNSSEDIEIRLDEDLTPYIEAGYVPYDAVRWIVETGDGVNTSSQNLNSADQNASKPDIDGTYYTFPSGHISYNEYFADYHTPTLRKYLWGRRISEPEHTEDGGAIPLGTWVYGCFPIIGSFNLKSLTAQGSGSMTYYDALGDGTFAYGNPYWFGKRNEETLNYEDWDSSTAIPHPRELNVINIAENAGAASDADYQWCIGMHTNYGYDWGMLMRDVYEIGAGWNIFGDSAGASHVRKPFVKSIGNVAKSGGSYCPIEYTQGESKAVRLDVTFNSLSGSDIVQGSVFSLFKCKILVDFALLEAYQTTDVGDNNVDFLVEADCFGVREGETNSINGGRGHNDIIRKEKVNMMTVSEEQPQTVVDFHGNVYEELLPTNPYQFSTGHSEEITSDIHYGSDTSLGLASFISDDGETLIDSTTIMNECDSHQVSPDEVAEGEVNIWRENLNSVDSISLIFRLGHNYQSSDFAEASGTAGNVSGGLVEGANFPQNIARGKFRCTINQATLKQRYIVGNVSQLDYYADVNGRIDEGEWVDGEAVGTLGSYTGNVFIESSENPTQEWLIRKPCDILLHILDKELDNTREIDEDSLAKARVFNWKFDFCKPEEEDARSFLDSFCKSTPFIARFKSDDKFSIISVTEMNMSSYSESTSILANDVFNFKHKRTSKENLVLKCRVLYGWDEGNKTFTKETNPYGDGGIPEHLERFTEFYNVKDINDYYLEFESKFIQDDFTAIELRNHLLKSNMNIHNIIECDLPLKYVMLEVGDLVNFDKLISGLKLFGNDYTVSEDIGWTDESGNFLKTGLAMPQFMVIKARKNLKKVSLTLLQLHSGVSIQESNPETYSGFSGSLGLGAGSGDNNFDGLLNVLDVVSVVSYITGAGVTLSEEQLNNADYNGDGLVDVLDVVGIITTITNGDS